jgi:hypothetical protein
MAPASSVGTGIVAIFSVSDSDQYEVGMSASMAASTRVMPGLWCAVLRPAVASPVYVRYSQTRRLHDTPDSLSASVGFGSSQAPLPPPDTTDLLTRYQTEEDHCAPGRLSTNR